MPVDTITNANNAAGDAKMLGIGTDAVIAAFFFAGLSVLVLLAFFLFYYCKNKKSMKMPKDYDENADEPDLFEIGNLFDHDDPIMMVFGNKDILSRSSSGDMEVEFTGMGLDDGDMVYYDNMIRSSKSSNHLAVQKETTGSREIDLFHHFSGTNALAQDGTDVYGLSAFTDPSSTSRSKDVNDSIGTRQPMNPAISVGGAGIARASVNESKSFDRISSKSAEELATNAANLPFDSDEVAATQTLEVEGAVEGINAVGGLDEETYASQSEDFALRDATGVLDLTPLSERPDASNSKSSSASSDKPLGVNDLSSSDDSSDDSSVESRSKMRV
jgi:hypothetical protein